MKNVPTKIIVHHDGASRAGTSFDVINQYHKDKQFPLSSLGFFVGYHFLIERDGSIRQARDVAEEGAHTVGENTSSVGVCLAGNMDEELPTKEQIISLGGLLGELVQAHNIKPTHIYPHRKYAEKTCYGSLLPDWWARLVYKWAQANKDPHINSNIAETLWIILNA